jgi:hypothetical protein
MSNEKEKQQVWCYYYKRKNNPKSRNLSNPHKSDDGKYQSETQMEQNSQIDEYETLMQKETKPNLNICNMSAAFLLAVPLGNSTTKSVCSDLTTVLSILNCTDCPIRCCKKFSKFVIVVPFKIFKINFCGLGTSSVETL